MHPAVPWWGNWAHNDNDDITHPPLLDKQASYSPPRGRVQQKCSSHSTDDQILPLVLAQQSHLDSQNCY